MTFFLKCCLSMTQTEKEHAVGVKLNKLCRETCENEYLSGHLLVTRNGIHLWQFSRCSAFMTTVWCTIATSCVQSLIGAHREIACCAHGQLVEGQRQVIRVLPQFYLKTFADGLFLYTPRQTNMIPDDFKRSHDHVICLARATLENASACYFQHFLGSSDFWRVFYSICDECLYKSFLGIFKIQLACCEKRGYMKNKHLKAIVDFERVPF